jgi:hypothetical protein
MGVLLVKNLHLICPISMHRKNEGRVMFITFLTRALYRFYGDFDLSSSLSLFEYHNVTFSKG